MVRNLTAQEKEEIANYLEKMDNLKVTIFPDSEKKEARFLIENSISRLPAQRVSRRLKLRGCQIENTGNSRQCIIRFPVYNF
jgi:hypothetical protein